MDLIKVSTPLEVLSSTAAAILQINYSEKDNCSPTEQGAKEQRCGTANSNSSGGNNNEATKATGSSKELPTKEGKMKRSKDRRELAHSSSFRSKRSASPQVDERSNPDAYESYSRMNPVNSGYGRSTGHAANAVDAPTGPVAYPSPLNQFNNDLYRRERSSSSCSLNYRGSPYQLPNGSGGDSVAARRNSDPNSGGQEPLDEMSDDDDDEKPLDMSKKTRNSNASESHHFRSVRSATSTPEGDHIQQIRPSVITCASSLFRTKHTMSPNCQSCNLSNDFSKCSASNAAEEYGHHSCTNTETFGGGRSEVDNGHSNRQILGGACDPVIDEHFRRSLGDDYSEMLSKPKKSNSTVSMSVDDHFAKALGATWTQLQKEDKDATGISSKQSKIDMDKT